MNTILGVLLVIFNGQIMGAQTVAAYPTPAACQAGVAEKVKATIAEKGPVPPGVILGKLCVDLTDELKDSPPKVKT